MSSNLILFPIVFVLVLLPFLSLGIMFILPAICYVFLTPSVNKCFTVSKGSILFMEQVVKEQLGIDWW
jgi:hypothetical protein